MKSVHYDNVFSLISFSTSSFNNRGSILKIDEAKDEGFVDGDGNKVEI